MPPLNDGIITEAAVEKAKQEYHKHGRLFFARSLLAHEPDLYEAINRFAINAFTDVDWDCRDLVEDRAFEAVWGAAMVALIAYRRCHYQLWAEMFAGTRLEMLDPDLRRAATADSPPSDSESSED